MAVILRNTTAQYKSELPIDDHLFRFVPNQYVCCRVSRLRHH